MEAAVEKRRDELRMLVRNIEDEVASARAHRTAMCGAIKSLYRFCCPGDDGVEGIVTHMRDHVIPKSQEFEDLLQGSLDQHWSSLEEADKWLFLADKGTYLVGLGSTTITTSTQLKLLKLGKAARVAKRAGTYASVVGAGISAARAGVAIAEGDTEAARDHATWTVAGLTAAACPPAAPVVALAGGYVWYQEHRRAEIKAKECAETKAEYWRRNGRFFDKLRAVDSLRQNFEEAASTKVALPRRQ